MDATPTSLFNKIRVQEWDFQQSVGNEAQKVFLNLQLHGFLVLYAHVPNKVVAHLHVRIILCPNVHIIVKLVVNYYY